MSKTRSRADAFSADGGAAVRSSDTSSRLNVSSSELGILTLLEAGGGPGGCIHNNGNHRLRSRRGLGNLGTNMGVFVSNAETRPADDTRTGVSRSPSLRYRAKTAANVTPVDKLAATRLRQRPLPLRSPDRDRNHLAGGRTSRRRTQTAVVTRRGNRVVLCHSLIIGSRI
jgi:hypothetical protein